MKEFFQALGFILITQSAGVAGSFFTISSINEWYVFLDKPPLTPPNWIFAPAWITLYTLIGLSAFLIWKKRGDIKEVKPALILFFAHLFLNAIWTPVFFGAQLVLPAFFIIIAVLITGAWVAFKFYKIRKLAGYLLVPYLAWVAFASYLNFGIYILN